MPFAVVELTFVTVVGTWTTLSVSDPEAAFVKLVCVTSPPPNTLALLVTLAGEFAGMLTVNVSRLNVPPAPATTCEEVHVTVVVPKQPQPVPVEDAKV